MYVTRSKARSENEEPIAPTTTAANTSAVNAATTSRAGSLENAPQTDQDRTLMEGHLGDDLDTSEESQAQQNSITSPAFSSITARGVREAFRQHNEPLRPTGPRMGGGNRQVTQADLRSFEERLLNLVPRIIQQSLEGRSQSQGREVLNRGSNISLPDVRQPPPRLGQNMQIQPWSDPMFNHLPNQRQEENNFRMGIPAPYGNNQRSAGPGLRIDKWGITFDGTYKGPSVEDFVFQVETLQADFGGDWQEILRSFQLLLSGPAKEWYWDHRRFNNVTRWGDLKAALLAQFHRFDSDFDIQRKILDRRQNDRESFEDFYNSIIKLRNQLRSPLGERELITVMKGNLKAPMAQLLFPFQTTSLAHFVKECRRAENLLASQRQFSGRQPMRSLHAIETEPTLVENVVEVDAIQTARRLQCWNCQEEGHIFVDCPAEQRTLFCYKCGLENTVTPRCPNCQGNRGQNVSRQGMEARSNRQYPTTQHQ